MGLRERIERRFLSSLRKAGIRPDDTVWLPVDCRIQSYAAMDILAKIEEEYDTVLNVLVLTPLSPCFNEVMSPYNVHRGVCHVTSYGGYKECVRRYLEGRGGGLIVFPFSAEDLALEMLGEHAVAGWRGFRIDVRFRTAYPFASTRVGELLKIYSNCGCVGHYGSLDAAALFERLSGRVTPTAASKIYVRLSGWLS